MKKKYEELSHISHNDGNAFADLVSQRIDQYQKKGCQVEVQYQHSFSHFSALILGYKEVGKL